MTRVSCRCGAFEAEITPMGPDHGRLIVCHCADCRAFARHMGEETDENGGTSLFILGPDQVKVLKGADQVRALRMTRGGAFRWYTACCGSAIGNTPGNPKVAFASMLASRFEDGADFGPVRAMLVPGDATKPVTGRGKAGLFLWVLGKMARSRITGRWRQTPFFAKNGRAVAKPSVISDEERAAAYEG